ncbi:MAG: TIGR03809 family protein [Xanthobacteraceae bacterium]
MAQRTDVDRGRAIIERWCALAEQRLDYLIDLRESGRWRRFHTEPDFLDNIREARAAVDTWRLLASREAALDNQPIDFGWLGQEAVPLAQRDIVKRGDCAVLTAAVPSPPVVPDGADRPDAFDALPLSGREAGLDVATMQERYPLLRNAL